jgi:hypothetical protein
MIAKLLAAYRRWRKLTCCDWCRKWRRNCTTHYEYVEHFAVGQWWWCPSCQKEFIKDYKVKGSP